MAGNSFLPFNFDWGSIFGGGDNNQAFPSFGTQAGNSLTKDVAAAPGMFSRQSMFGGTDPSTGISTGGWAPVALGAGQAIFGALQGNKAMGLAEKQFQEGQRQFDLNFDAQRKTINTQLEDRQRARVASNSGAYESTDDYLRKNRV